MKTVSIPSKIIRTHKDGTVDTYHVRKAIGKGGFATVYEVLRYKTDQRFAIKAIPLANLKENGRIKRQLEEINIQTSLNHPNILRSYDYFKDTSNLYMVLELCPYNTVYKLLKDKGKFSELDAADIIKQVLEGVKYLHENSVIHRDIKLQNLLIGSDGKIKISDFGISIKLSSQIERCYSTCGTYGFMPPEMLKDDDDGYSFESDIWSIGVCTFLLLTGQSPFLTKDKVRTERLIRNAQYKIPSHSHLSSTSKDFIRSILQANPEDRPSIGDLLHHPFILNSEKTPHQNFFQELVEKSVSSQKAPEQLPQPPQKQPNKPQEQPNQPQEQLTKLDQPLKPSPNKFAQSLKPKRPKLCKPSPQKSDQLQKKIVISSPDQCKKIEPPISPPINDQFNKSCRHRHSKQRNQSPESPEKQKKNEHRRPSPKKEQIPDEKIQQEQNDEQQQKLNESIEQEQLFNQKEQDNHHQLYNEKQNHADNQQQEITKEEENQPNNEIHEPIQEKVKEKDKQQENQAEIQQQELNKNENQISKENQDQEQKNQSKQENQNQIQQVHEMQNQDKQIEEQQNQLNQENKNQEQQIQQQKQEEQNQDQSNQKQTTPKKQEDKSPEQQKNKFQIPDEEKKKQKQKKSEAKRHKSKDKKQKENKQEEDQHQQNNFAKSYNEVPLINQSKQEENNLDKQQDILSQSLKLKRTKMHKQSDLQVPNNQENGQQADPNQVETIKKKKNNHTQKRKSPGRQKSPANETANLIEKNDENNSQANGHSIPSYCVIRFCNKSKRGDLYYFMKNGQVGMISHDHQRLVLDPFGEFIQMWPDIETNMPKILSPKEADKMKNVSKLLKYEKAFKETNTHLLELPESKPQKGVPMRHVKYWMGSESGLLFRMDNRVIQVNFQDKSKLIVFWEQKSLISTHSLFENGSFIAFSNLKKSKDSELKQKYTITKKMVDAMNKGAY